MSDTYTYVCCGCGELRIISKPKGENLQIWRDGLEIMEEHDLRLMCPHCEEHGKVPFQKRLAPHEKQST